MAGNRSFCICLISLLAGSAADAASLKATSTSQLIQNKQAEVDNLSRMETEVMTERWARLKLIEPVPVSTRSYYLHAVPASQRYLRPWTKLFLTRLSAQFRARFGKPLRITSLLRTASYQHALRGRNRNAAPASGPRASSHLTGASLDISKKGLRGAEIAWLRRVLLSLKNQGYLYAIEEFRQPNFHIMVYRNYDDYVEQRLAQAD